MRNACLPTAKAFLLFGPQLIFSVVALIWPDALYLVLALNGLGVILILVDFFISPHYKKQLELAVELPPFFILNQINPFRLLVLNKELHELRFNILFDLDEAVEQPSSSNILRVKPMVEAELLFMLLPRRRGSFKATTAFLRGRSLLGFLAFYRSLRLEFTVTVPPHLKPLKETFKLIQKKLYQNYGQQLLRQFGTGHEFEILKEYAKGDDFNHIDWKASARNRKPVSKVYRLENNLDLLILLDCGRMMGTEVGGISLLDYAIDAAMVLSYAAVRNHDQASLLCFGSEVRHYLPPIKTKRGLATFRLVLSSLDFENGESDYRYALRIAAQKLTKRSLLVLLTDIIDDANLNIFKSYLGPLSKRHLVILVALRDKNLFAMAYTSKINYTTVFLKAASADLLLRRKNILKRLSRLGVDVLDLEPEDVTPRLLSRYLYHRGRN